MESANAVVPKRNWKNRFGIGAIVAAAIASFSASNVMAADTIADLFTGVNISGVQTSVYTFLAALVAIGLLFFGRALLRKLGVSV